MVKECLVNEFKQDEFNRRWSSVGWDNKAMFRAQEGLVLVLKKALPISEWWSPTISGYLWMMSIIECWSEGKAALLFAVCPSADPINGRVSNIFHVFFFRFWCYLILQRERVSTRATRWRRHWRDRPAVSIETKSTFDGFPPHWIRRVHNLHYKWLDGHFKQAFLFALTLSRICVMFEQRWWTGHTLLFGHETLLGLKHEAKVN